MTFELDPDLWLHAKLSLGRGWRLAAALAGAGLTFVAMSWTLLSEPDFAQFGFQLALLVLIMAPARASARLLDLERGGLLDQIRLCGRPPERLLAAFVLGSTGPWALLASLLIGNYLWLGGDVRSLALALLVFGGALAAALIVYGALPAAMTPDSRFIAPLLMVLGIAAFFALENTEWVQRFTFDTVGRVTAIAIVTIALPLAVWLANRRIERPRADGLSGGRAGLMGGFARLVPHTGPPEFLRQLRCILLSGGAVPVMIAAPIAILVITFLRRIDSPFRSFVLNAIPYTVVFIGTYATSAAARRELTTATFDFVRLTPQHPDTVALSWYGGSTLPFWIAAALAALTLQIAAPGVYALGWPLVAIAFMLPALSLAEALQQRRPGTLAWLAWLMGASLMPYVIVQSVEWVPPSPLPAGFRQLIANRSWTPWALSTDLIPVLVAVVAASVAAGRVRRPNGPALAGLAAAAGGLALSLAVGLISVVFGSWRAIAVFPRLVVGSHALFSVFAAEERDVPSAPWRRLGFISTAAFLGTAGVSLALSARTSAVFVGYDCQTQLWLTCVATRDFLATGALAALAAGIGLLAHELLWRVPLVSLGVRLAVALGLMRRPWLLYPFVFLRASTSISPPQPPRIAPLVDSADVIVLGAIFVFAVIAHTTFRGRRKASASAIAP